MAITLMWSASTGEGIMGLGGPCTYEDGTCTAYYSGLPEDDIYYLPIIEYRYGLGEVTLVDIDTKNNVSTIWEINNYGEGCFAVEVAGDIESQADLSIACD
jgi:hypothetical protein